MYIINCIQKTLTSVVIENGFKLEAHMYLLDFENFENKLGKTFKKIG